MNLFWGDPDFNMTLMFLEITMFSGLLTMMIMDLIE